MAVRAIEERPADHLRVVGPESAPQQPIPQPKPKSQNYEAFLGAMTAISHILAARFILLMAGVGAFVLVMMEVLKPSVQGLIAMTAYDVLVFLPLVYLASRPTGKAP